MQLYGILGLTPSATESEIKKAYYKLAKIYHPDKNNDNNENTFQQINYAYTILINPKTREEYLKLNSAQENNFIKFLMKITINQLTMEDLNNLNIKIKDLVGQTLKSSTILDFIKNQDFIQIFNIFNNIKVKKNHLITETEEEDTVTQFYYYNLPPKFIDYNINNINLEFDVNISNILNIESKKIKIIRNIFDKQLKENFTFEIKSPYIVFPNKGDNNKGHLIIKLNLKENIDWYEDMIVINYPITIHQYIYGLDVNVNIFNDDYSYNKWIPNRDGNLIYIKNHNISIKFMIDYKHNDEKEQLLLNLFTNESIRK